MYHPGDNHGIDFDALRHQVADDNFALRPHAMQHAVKEGFTRDDVSHVVLSGVVVESYPERKRCLFYADVVVEGITGIFSKSWGESRSDLLSDNPMAVSKTALR